MPRLFVLLLVLAALSCGKEGNSDGTDHDGRDASVTDAGTDDAGASSDDGTPVDAGGTADAEEDAENVATPWPLDAAGTHVVRETVGGLEREYRLVVPEGEPLTGLVLLLHGSGQTSESFTAKRGRFIQLAGERNWLVVVPQATVRGEKPSWNYHRAPEDADDTAFLTALLDRALQEGVPGRRFVAGFSNGGRMTMSMLAQMPERFDAGGVIASNFGVYANDGGPDRIVPDATGPASVWIANGSQDPSVPFDGGTTEGGTAVSADDTVAVWTAIAQCPSEPVEVSFPSEQGFRRTYSPCAEETEVVQVAYRSGVHAWPEDGDVTGFSANQELIEFFERSP